MLLFIAREDIIPYTTKNPPDKIKDLPDHAKAIWIAAYNNADKEYNGDEEKLNAVAWGAVKKKYEQKDGKWVAKGDNASERIAIEPFGAIDPSKPIKILPVGTFYRDGRVLGIDDARAAEIVKNFHAGLPRYGVKVNVEHGGEPSQPGKVGLVKEISHVPGDGIYATKLELTNVGKKLVEEDRYDAPSPEMVWTLNGGAKYQDPKTGKWYDNVLTGLALTTSPFFGSDVAVFSVKKDRMNMADLQYANDNDGDFDDPQSQAMTMVRTLALVSDMADDCEGVEGVGEPLNTAKESIKEALAKYISQFSSALLKVERFAEWDTAYINDLPDSSFAYVEDGEKDESGKTVPRSKRHLPYKDKGGKVDLSHLRNAMTRLDGTDIPATAKAEAKKKLLAAEKSKGVGEGAENASLKTSPESFQDTGDVHMDKSLEIKHADMPVHHGDDGEPSEDMIKEHMKKLGDGKEDKQVKDHLQEHLDSIKSEKGGRMTIEVKPEEFAAIKAKADLVEKLSADNKKLAEDFAAERFLRRRGDFLTMAEEKFNAVPAKTEDLADKLLWLQDADATEKKDHYNYFVNLLDTANKALAQSEIFKAFGTEHAGSNGSKHPFEEKVEQIRLEQFKDKPYAQGYSAAFKKVSEDHKDLARQYANDRMARRA